MKIEIKNTILFFIIYISIVILLFFSNNGEALIIETLYQNITFFALYLFFSSTLLFDFLNNKECEDIYLPNILKRIFLYNFCLAFGLLFLNFIIFSILNAEINFYKCFILSLKLFVTLIVVSFFIVLFFSLKNKEKNNNYTGNLFLFFAYLLYVLTQSYGNNIIFINFYKYYFKDSNLIIMVIHYFIWGFIPLGILYFKDLRTRKLISRK